MIHIFFEIACLIEFGVKYNFIHSSDKTLVTNQLLDVLSIEDYQEISTNEHNKLKQFIETTSYPTNILDNIVNWCIETKRLTEPTIINKDLLNAKIIGTLIPRSSEIINNFYDLYKQNKQLATNYFYEFSKKTNYIRTDRICNDIRWKYKGKYGILDITINLSKPEKDPKDIANAKNIPSKSYPKCVLCRENEGYRGSIHQPARQNHRLIPLTLKNETWFLQYSPYIYYNEHCIVLSDKHKPMKIDALCFERLFEFVELFPHYFIGSNADLPIVGGSILTHEHFQGGKYSFAMENASIEKQIYFEQFPSIKAGILNWPLSVIRLQGTKKELLKLATHILNTWIQYNDFSANIHAFSDNERHNTITPILRFKNGQFELDLVLRNNRTSTKYPLGIFHPHQEHHNIKKENIGLIEVMGLAVLPGRLKTEIEKMKSYFLTEKNPFIAIEKDEEVNKHLNWCKTFIDPQNITHETINMLFEEAIGKTFEKVLENCNVFQYDTNGFQKFIQHCNTHIKEEI